MVTLTKVEWTYLLNTRVTTSGIRYAKGTVMGVSGLIIVPDNWSTSTYPLSSTNSSSASYTANTITYADWLMMDAAGCVFLPTTGGRNGNSANNFYWSATYNESTSAYSLVFSNYSLGSSYNSSRSAACSVRLVRDITQ